MSAPPGSTSSLLIRRAREGDLADLVDMVADFSRGHPSEHHARSPERLRAAYFGDDPVARLFVAERRAQVIGMAQWSRTFDMFWSMSGGKAEWLYVRPSSRGLGVAPALMAAICADIRLAGGEYLCGGYGAQLAPLYEKVTDGWPTRECYVSAEAFQLFADLAGRSPRDIVRGLPTPALNRTPARPR